MVLVLKLESLGKENCPAFTLVDPLGRVLYADFPADHRARCGRVGAPETVDPSVEFGIIDGEHYLLRKRTTISGLYYLTIDEGSDADNFIPYSWDYRLTATAESSSR